MKIFDDLTELRQYLPRFILTREDQISEFIDNALEDHIYPYIPPEEADRLLSAGTDRQQRMLKRAIAYYTAFDYLHVGQNAVSGAGVQQGETATARTSSFADRQEMKNFYASRADRALELLLSMLSTTPSSGIDTAEGFLIPSASVFNRYVNIGGSRRTFAALLPVLLSTQRHRLMPVLSEPFLKALLAYMQGEEPDFSAIPILSGIEVTDSWLEQILETSRGALATLSMAEAIPSLTLRLDAGALSVASFYSPSPSDRAALEASLSDMRESLLSSGRTYTEEIASLLSNPSRRMLENRIESHHATPGYF